MHELGIIIKAMETIENFAKENNIDKVDTIVFEVGEVSGVLSLYVTECFPAAAYEHPFFKDTKCKIIDIPGDAVCKNCGTEFNVVKNKGYCPNCNSFDKTLIRGGEFMIKEIIVPNDTPIEDEKPNQEAN